MPFGFTSASKLVNFPFEEKLLLYMTIGGIPEYLRVASGYSNYYQFIEREFGDANGYFYREPYFILSQKFREYSTYFSITNAISFGKIKPSEIAGFIGIESKRLYPYLQNLAKLMFISPSIPIDHRKGAGHYELRDNMIKFCFNYVFPNREFIERENSKLIFDFPAYFGRIFEDFIKNDVFGYLYPYYNIGTWWHKDTEIDI
ncbi:MAG: ATP-binding protein, partial [Cuniculiplasma divulgatum]